jgi:hypothetical protein
MFGVVLGPPPVVTVISDVLQQMYRVQSYAITGVSHDSHQ